MARRDGQAVGVVGFEIEGGRIRTIFIVNDASKLRRLGLVKELERE